MNDSELKDFDMFFYYGQNDLELETQHDISCNLVQSKKSLFYNRCLDSSGIPDYENVPDALNLQIKIPYDIVNSMSRRNQYVSNGEDNTKDRRIAISQALIKVKSNNKGNIDITAYYISLATLKQNQVQVGI